MRLSVASPACWLQKMFHSFLRGWQRAAPSNLHARNPFEESFEGFEGKDEAPSSLPSKPSKPPLFVLPSVDTNDKTPLRFVRNYPKR